MAMLARLAPRHLGPTPVVVAATVVVLLTVATGIGLRQPGSRNLPGLVGAAQPDFTVGTPPLVRVSDEFLKRAVGARTFARAVGGGGDTTVASPSRRDDRRGHAPGPTVKPKRGLFTPRGLWELQLAMDPDRVTVAPGEFVHYRIQVANVGADPFDGYIVLQWHIPTHTSAAPPCITDLFVPVCDLLAPYLLAPGTGEDEPLGVHPYRFGHSVTIEAGSTYTYHVVVRVHRVVPSGTLLNDHAHLDVGGGDTGQVTARAPAVAVLEAAA